MSGDSLEDGSYRKQFGCSHCSKKFQSQKDVDRHQSSVHDKSATYFAASEDAADLIGDITRKGNYETHLRSVHKKSSKDSNLAVGQPTSIFSQIDSRKEVKEGRRGGYGLEGCSREELIEMVLVERGKVENERLMRLRVEEELKILRQRHEKREDMLLKLLVTKGANS